MKYIILFVVYVSVLAFCDVVLHLPATWMFFSGFTLGNVAYAAFTVWMFYPKEKE